MFIGKVSTLRRTLGLVPSNYKSGPDNTNKQYLIKNYSVIINIFITLSINIY